MIKDEQGNTLFSEKELKCKGSGQIFLDEIFAEKLKILRIKFNYPMLITSCCRSVEYNKKIGGANKSFHIFDISKNIKTCAADIKIPPLELKAKLIMLALEEGFSIGLHKNFIHLDYRELRQFKQTVFLY